MEPAGRREGQFRVKETAFGGEHVQIVGESASIAQLSEMERGPEGRDLGYLCFRLLAGGANRHEGILDLSKGDQDGLLVLSEDLPRLRLDRSLFVPQSLSVEKRTCQAETRRAEF